MTRERALVDELGEPVERVLAQLGELVDVERAELQLGRLEARPMRLDEARPLLAFSPFVVVVWFSFVLISQQENT